MKKCAFDYLYHPRDKCDCKLIGFDDIENPVWDRCFRCSVLHVLYERHRRIEMSLLIAYGVIAFGSILFRIGFDKGWW